ncbi:uncharacterized protein ACA1_069120 [Acanthamoeba castellanii str. Neff]|uniref:CCZ1/INTU/HPS4 third Longin domain-containing protein n=1 Tax=Acanthamoeba castellanii (strain ATCC 30010 / Neff) TaxID=1257118 RepID=L8HEY0_ACACF|nr:uncharacterized protein ACA1_069120 [Acanthamoeba castellanii str. Neff]ELR23328.1 hypothetical protein ACA1_069120 [Acanthamoeba castellanii str. Neff]
MGEEDATLAYQLEALYRAFRFYNGSFADVFEQYKNSSRRELQQKFREMGSLLIPLLQSLQKNIMRAFDPLPYTELPGRGNTYRYFLTASQLLNDIKANPLNLGGVLFWDKSVLCTHLDVDTTRWILNLVVIMASSRRRDTGKRVQHIDDAERSSHHPFMSKEALHGLRKNRDTEPARSSAPPSSSSAPPGGGSGNASPGPGDKGGQRASSSSSIPTQRAVRLPEVMTKEHEDGEYVGLYIICLQHISLAVVMNQSALYDTRHTNSIKLCFSELLSMEQNFARACKSSPPTRRLAHAVCVKKPASPVDNGPKQYNFLTYEKLTCMAKGTAPTAQKEVDRSFLQMTAKAHNMFMKDPSVSQVLMRDNNGAVYCRRTLGKEVYYQQFQQQKTHYEFIHRIEKTVRTNLQEEHNITVL